MDRVERVGSEWHRKVSPVGDGDQLLSEETGSVERGGSDREEDSQANRKESPDASRIGSYGVSLPSAHKVIDPTKMQVIDRAY